MDTAQSLYDAGDLDGAITLAAATVKARPADAAIRSFFVELLCFDGQIERAAKQVEVIARMMPDHAAGAGKFLLLLEGERTRQAVLGNARLPDLFDPPDQSLEMHLRGLVLLNGGDLSAGRDLLEKAEGLRAPAPGLCDGAPFADLRDLDDILAPVLEVIMPDGRYLWVPYSGLAAIAFRPPERVRDLIWRGGELQLRDGRRGPVYVPALYPTPSGQRAALRLGRETDWDAVDGTARGLGRKCLLVGDEDRDLVSVSHIAMGSALAEAGQQ